MARSIRAAGLAAGTAAIAVAAGGAALMLTQRRAHRHSGMSDAPAHTRRDSGSLVGRTVTVNRPDADIHALFADPTRFPAFMENVERVERLDDRRFRWTVKGPLGTDIDFTSRITEEEPGRLVAWESEPGSDIRHAGRVELSPAPPGRGTIVRLTLDYEPPLGAAGRAVAKLLQREPNVQARRDMRRMKQLMEAGEVTRSASPSARRGEDPTRQTL